VKLQVILLVLSILALGFGSFAATRAYYGQQACPVSELTALQDYLQLSHNQRRSLSRFDSRYLDRREELRRRVWDARVEFLNVLRDPDSSASDAILALDRLRSAQRAMQVNTVSYIFQLRRHLTSQQREKLLGAMDRGMCALTGGQVMGRGWGGCGGCGWSDSTAPGLGRRARRGL